MDEFDKLVEILIYNIVDKDKEFNKLIEEKESREAPASLNAFSNNLTEQQNSK